MSRDDAERFVLRSERAQRGVSRRTLAGPSFDRVTRAVYVPRELADDLAARCAAALAVVPGAVVSHWSAARLHGLPTTASGLARIHLVVPPGRRASRRPELCVHSGVVAGDLTRARGLPVTGTVRTWLDLAAHGADVVDLVVVGDAALRAEPGWDGRVATAVAAARGRRGVRAARLASGLLDAGSESPMESWVRAVLVLAGVPRPSANHVVRDGAGRLVARVDLAWPRHRLAVEYDGRHHLNPGQWQRDLRRRERLEAQGWSVIVLTAADLPDPRAIVRRVRDRLSALRPHAPSGQFGHASGPTACPN